MFAIKTFADVYALCEAHNFSVKKLRCIMHDLNIPAPKKKSNVIKKAD